ncbi:MAG: hypothetical protein [Microvirus sp.]|nr:MAG: hypothetical protein [Microvirus sp.]
MWPTIISGALSLLGGAMGNRAQKSANEANVSAQERINAANIAAQEASDARNLALVQEYNAHKGVDFAKLRADAQAAGFNPLTALAATGGAGYSDLAPPMGSAAVSQAAFIAPSLSLSDSISNLGMQIGQQQHELAMQGLDFDQQTQFQAAQFAHDAEMAKASLAGMMGAMAPTINVGMPDFWPSGAQAGTQGGSSSMPGFVDPNMAGWTYQDALNRGFGPLLGEAIPAGRMIGMGFAGLAGEVWKNMFAAPALPPLSSWLGGSAQSGPPPVLPGMRDDQPSGWFME